MLISLRTVDAAEPVSYWVLGSFSAPGNAAVEQQRLQSLLGAPLEVRRSNQGGHYRVLAEAGRISKAALAAREIDAWLLRLDTPATLALASPDSGPPDHVVTIEPAPAMPQPHEKPEPVPLFEALKPEETLAEYCQRLPGSRLCQHPLSAWALRHEDRLLRGQASLQAACEQSQSESARDICRQWRDQQ